MWRWTKGKSKKEVSGQCGDETVRKGALHRQLDISESKHIPVGLLDNIRRTEIGKTAKNPTKTGKKNYKVTKLMKARAVQAENFRK